MPVIIPPTWAYVNLNNDDGSNSGGYTGGGGGISPFSVLFCLVLISYSVFAMGKMYKSKTYEKELKYGTEQILNAAHTDAVNSADTININEYELVSPRGAKLDSARYARKITRFIKRSGTEFLGWEIDYTRRVYVLTVDKKLIAKDTKFLKLSNGYKRAVEQLAVQRRISKQK